MDFAQAKGATADVVGAHVIVRLQEAGSEVLRNTERSRHPIG